MIRDAGPVDSIHVCVNRPFSTRRWLEVWARGLRRRSGGGTRFVAIQGWRRPTGIEVSPRRRESGNRRPPTGLEEGGDDQGNTISGETPHDNGLLPLVTLPPARPERRRADAMPTRLARLARMPGPAGAQNAAAGSHPGRGRAPNKGSNLRGAGKATNVRHRRAGRCVSRWRRRISRCLRSSTW